METLKNQLTTLATAARAGLEDIPTNKRGIGLASFPLGTCGPVSELMGRIVLERLGVEGIYVCGECHPDLKSQTSHAWLEVDGLIVDLTHDQFEGTGLTGWVHESSEWHAKFNREVLGLCLSPEQWGQYPHAAYAAMKRACDAIALGAA